MGLYKYKPEPSGSMGVLWALATLRDVAVLEFGAMGHMLDARINLGKAGLGQTAGLFSTHIDDIDIALGGVERVNNAVERIAQDGGVKAVFLLPSAVPEIIGTDFHAIATELQPSYPDIEIIDFGFSGLTTDANRGVRETLLTLVKRLAHDVPKEAAPTFNLIGSCADFMRFKADAAEIERIMRGAFGVEPGCVLTSGTSIEEIKSIGAAHINLVLRKEGRAAAEYLEQRFGTPFIDARPYGLHGTVRWVEEIGDLLGIRPCRVFMDAEFSELDYHYDTFEKLYRRSKFYGNVHCRLSACAHSDVVNGIAAFADELHFERNRFWCNDPDGGTADIPYLAEAEWAKLQPDMAHDILMASGDVLALAGGDGGILLSHPHRLWSVCLYDAPFMGFRGAINLISMWIYEIQKRSG